jgi:hypothetical protein
LNLSESNQKQTIVSSSSTSSTNSIDIDTLALSIRTQTEQNQLLRRVFNELEKELRALTENRIALEIKLDYLNSATQSIQPTSMITQTSLNPNLNLPQSNNISCGKKQSVQVTPIIAGGNTQINPSSNLSSSITNQNTNTPSVAAAIINQTPTTKTNIAIPSKINI